MLHTKENRGVKAPLLLIPGLFITTLLVWGPNVHYGHAYAFLISGMAAMALMMRNTILTAFVLYLSCWFAFLLSAGSRGIVPVEITAQAVDSIMLTLAGVGVYICARHSKGTISTYFNWICILVLVLVVMGLVQVFIGKGSPVATLGNQNFFAAFIAISTVFFIRKRWWVFLPVLALSLYVARTSTAIAAAFVSCAFYFWGWRGAVLSFIPAVMYYLLFKIPVHALSLGARLDYWTDALGKISNSWQTLLFGVGPGVYWQFQNELHSEPVYLIFNLGIIGLAIVAAYIFRSFTQCNDRRLQAALLAVVVDSFGNHVMHTAPTALLVIIILGLIDRKNTVEASI